MITGIICEYNPLHRGHARQIRLLKDRGDTVVCLMSGNFVQRGEPAIVDKTLRAEAAIRCGADLVLELPVTYALSSAEGFAAGGVSILSPLCDQLCFGAETADGKAFMETAQALLSPAFSEYLRLELDKGKSFPAARQAALTAMGMDANLLETPNNILGVEYCKAILSQNSPMQPLVIHRPGSYHDTRPDPENPSATSLRLAMTGRKDWASYIPTEAAECFQNAALHTLHAGERAVLAKLRTMSDEEFEALPYGSEGLWRKLMRAARQEATLEEILTAVKSKRYTRSRLDRMVMCAFLGITREMLEQPAPYARVLAFNDAGRQILSGHKESGFFRNAGETIDDAYQALEIRCGRLYGLFAEPTPEAPDTEAHRRIRYLK